ncbi:hypothetical protein EDB92DRAFT_333596 [Lactarius akahatsu]|uniref:Uncharacterized protein n=1 Tax=Lactarius akahatsu TaxID=416441 RepID=A0AAD4L4C3_9AGAM|nr:hypothetical protein EDB92DRAFT_333596 [Lactarius akahatsu]
MATDYRTPLTSVGPAPTENLNPWITPSPLLPLSNFESLPSPPPSAHPPASQSISASVRPQPVFLTAREQASTAPTTHLDPGPKPELATSRCRFPECEATVTGDVAARLSGFCSHRHMHFYSSIRSAMNMHIATPCPKCGIRACPEGQTSCSDQDSNTHLLSPAVSHFRVEPRVGRLKFGLAVVTCACLGACCNLLFAGVFFARRVHRCSHVPCTFRVSLFLRPTQVRSIGTNFGVWR